MADAKSSAKVIDFTNVKETTRTGIKAKRVPEGDYLARVTSVQDAEVRSGDNKGDFQWLFVITPEDYPTAHYPYYCKLEANQLWKIRNLLLAAGINVPKKRVKLDPEKVVGKLIAITLEDDEYDGKPKSTIASIFPPQDLTGGTEPEDEEEEEDEEDEEPTPPPAKKRRRAAPAPEPEDEEEEEDEDEEEEEPEPEPEPAPRRKKRRKPQVTDEDLEELDIEDV